MRHVVTALQNMESDLKRFISLENTDVPGIPPIVSFTIQSDPIGLQLPEGGDFETQNYQ